MLVGIPFGKLAGSLELVSHIVPECLRINAGIAPPQVMTVSLQILESFNNKHNLSK